MTIKRLDMEQMVYGRPTRTVYSRRQSACWHTWCIKWALMSTSSMSKRIPTSRRMTSWTNVPRMSIWANYRATECEEVVNFYIQIICANLFCGRVRGIYSQQSVIVRSAGCIMRKRQSPVATSSWSLHNKQRVLQTRKPRIKSNCIWLHTMSSPLEHEMGKELMQTWMQPSCTKRRI